MVSWMPVGREYGGASAEPICREVGEVLVYCEDCADSVVSAVSNDLVAQGVPAGEMPLLTLAVLMVGENGGTSGAPVGRNVSEVSAVPACRVDGGASGVLVGEMAVVTSPISMERKTGGGAEVLYK